MSALFVTGLRKSYGGTPVLGGIDLDVPEGAITALLGPSGCGKTTLLRLVAGFDRPDAGEITLAGRPVAGPRLHVPPEQRRLGYVPQEGALFPHLTVAHNVGFGLTRAERRGGRIEEVLRLTNLSELAERHPHQLSGGQQQRAALARALAPRPDLILLDEPFNGLDLGLRRGICEEVMATLRRGGGTAVLVTHDPLEAFASADRVAVMRDGVIAQSGDPASVYRQPVDSFVALTTGAAIFVDGQVCGRSARTALGELDLHEAASVDGPATIMLRPEQIVLTRPGQGPPAEVADSLFQGDHTRVTVTIAGLTLPLRLIGARSFSPGDHLHLRVEGACAALCDPPKAFAPTTSGEASR